eukprot:gnl/MRDRNA2_/MRDRNA2_342114_c0_seq1.p1 gnl/MRDRNA2_/MRDRNA2_342114_c0~~gnl/MRDRNA2_/MRDRNA2_342114_c0_seq1.p1  ORF type:complete len:148 (-),score=17.26 gnl/MRDRNA2_/MRDRNA2_342114_c0_seq1:42-485(-)
MFTLRCSRLSMPAVGYTGQARIKYTQTVQLTMGRINSGSPLALCSCDSRALAHMMRVTCTIAVRQLSGPMPDAIVKQGAVFLDADRGPADKPSGAVMWTAWRLELVANFLDVLGRTDACRSLQICAFGGGLSHQVPWWLQVIRHAAW